MLIKSVPSIIQDIDINPIFKWQMQFVGALNSILKKRHHVKNQLLLNDNCVNFLHWCKEFKKNIQYHRQYFHVYYH